MSNLFQSQHWLYESLAGLQDTLAAWQDAYPDMGVFAMVPEALAHCVTGLQQVCQAGGIPLLGAVFPALIADTGLRTDGIWLMRMDTMPPHFLVGGLPNDLAGAMHRLRNGADNVARQTVLNGGSLFLVFDSMLPHIGSLMTTWCADLSEQLRCWGVNAGSETFQPMPCLFDNSQLVGNGLLGLSMAQPLAAVLRHGYPVSKAKMKATATHGNCIDFIDGRPALSVYQEIVREEYGIELTRENFYAYGVHFPFGVITALDVLVRIPVGLTDEGAIYCVGEVSPNSSLRVLRAPALDASQCVAQLAQHLGDAGAHEPLTAFYCAGRRMHFGADTAQELAKLASASRSSCLHGALTLGELDTIDAQGLLFPRFHNAAIVCMT
jgi:hypothetical protein